MSFSIVLKFMSKNIHKKLLIPIFMFLPTGGFYCPGGTTYPSLPCSAGYFCRSGAQIAAPSQGSGADNCPVGYYCPEMTTEPIACPVGTFSNSTGLRNETDCISCTQGIYQGSIKCLFKIRISVAEYLINIFK